MRVKRKFVPVLALALVLVACSDSTLLRVAKDLDIAQQTIGTVQTTVIEANRRNLISEDTTRTILITCKKVNEIGLEAVAYTKTITALDEASRTKLVNMLTPASTAVGNLVQSGTLGITNVETKQKVQLLLESLRATLSGVQLALAGG